MAKLSRGDCQGTPVYVCLSVLLWTLGSSFLHTLFEAQQLAELLSSSQVPAALQAQA